jgi:hypothetical protein
VTGDHNQKGVHPTRVTAFTYSIVQLRYSGIRNWQSRQQNEVEERVDVRFFREIQTKGTLPAISGLFQVLHDLAKQWQ